MLCPLCDNETDFTLEEMEVHLREFHKFNDEGLIHFGETHDRLVEDQIRREKV